MSSPPEPPLDPRGSARPLPTSGCARTLPGVRSPHRFGVRSPSRVPGCPGLGPLVPHPQAPPWAQTPWTLRDIKGQPGAFSLRHHHPPAGLPPSNVPPPSCAAPAAGAMGQDTPPRCCRGAQCQHRPGTPGKWQCCRWGAGGAVGGRGRQGVGPLPTVTPPALPGDGSWHSWTLSRLSGGGGAGRGAEVPGGEQRCQPQGCGGATPDRSPLWHPPARDTQHWVQPPKPFGRTPWVLPRLAADPGAAWGWRCWGSPPRGSGGA